MHLASVHMYRRLNMFSFNARPIFQETIEKFFYLGSKYLWTLPYTLFNTI